MGFPNNEIFTKNNKINNEIDNELDNEIKNRIDFEEYTKTFCLGLILKIMEY